VICTFTDIFSISQKDQVRKSGHKIVLITQQPAAAAAEGRFLKVRRILLKFIIIIKPIPTGIISKMLKIPAKKKKNARERGKLHICFCRKRMEWSENVINAEFLHLHHHRTITAQFTS
jgi:hypothetical protein